MQSDVAGGIGGVDGNLSNPGEHCRQRNPHELRSLEGWNTADLRTNRGQVMETEEVKTSSAGVMSGKKQRKNTRTPTNHINHFAHYYIKAPSPSPPDTQPQVTNEQERTHHE